MVNMGARARQVLGLGVAAMFVLSACGGATSSSSAAPASGGASAAPSSGGASAAPSEAAGGPVKGGTLYVLTAAEQWNQVDPQRVYTGEDMAFFGSTIYRGLLGYKKSPDPTEGTSLEPDIATDTGTATDGGKTWSFTLKDGVKWQDGSAVTCEDFKYGISRTFATDVINQGPTYAIQYLDIPLEADAQTSQYKGPYTGVGQDLYDKAVVCDGNTITFHLNKPVADFNYATTLGMFPVPKAADTGETYGVAAPPMSNGPYKIDSYTTGKGGKMLMSRNENWDPATDPTRKALPDKWEVDFGVDPKVMDQRLMAGSGNDAFAVQYGDIQPENLAAIFVDPQTTTEQFNGRAVSGFDPYSLYFWINVQKVKNEKIRQAMAVALDRDAIKANLGGAFAGELADGVIKPNIGIDYAATGLWDSFFGQPVPATGDPELAKKLIAESGEPAPTLVYNFQDTPVQQKQAAIVIDSLGKAGITVTPAPIERGKYYSVVFDPEKAGDFGWTGWGADWPNASTVIPPLFTQKGGWDISQVEDAEFSAKIDAASATLDRQEQAKAWQALDKEAAERMFTIPTLYTLSQTLAGGKVGPIFRWPAYGSWPYSELGVIQ